MPPRKKKSATPTPQRHPPAPPLNGTRRAEQIARQIYRWMERKWPLALHAREWLRFGAALRVTAELIETDARRILNPGAFAKTRAEIVRSKQEAEATEE